MAKDFYEVLGIARGASADEIKKAYRALSKELHPDKHKGEKAAEQRFKEVNVAYEVLSNPQKRQMYDQFGSAGPGGGGGGGGGFGNGFQGFDFSQFSGGDMGGFSDLFEGFFGGGRGQRRQADEHGQDREVELQINLQDVVKGVRHSFDLRRLRPCERCGGRGADPGSQIITCSECGGTGQVTHVAQSFFGTVQQRTICPKCRGAGKVPEKPCSACAGEGRTQQTSPVQVEVPAGISDGQTLRLKGEGDAGRHGSVAGDLYVHIRVKPDPRFQRDGDDIRTEAMVPVLDAILGTTLAVETVHGSVSLKIPAGTQPEQVLRIKGKGLPVLSSSRMGDHFVTVKVLVPTKLSRKEQQLLEEWRRIV